ncbi:DNA-binding protein [Pediococcus argentinicus]|uniref:DNA-binding protein n=1 Tax=Pediococcus argentinicus TaxID=480391 RepID=UPI00338EFFC3
MQMIPLQISDDALESIRAEMLASAKEAFEQTAKQQAFPKFMTKDQAAKYLHVSFKTLQKYVVLGLPVIEVDGIQRLDRNDLDNFYQSHKI